MLYQGKLAQLRIKGWVQLGVHQHVQNKNIFAFRDVDAENVLTFPLSAGEQHRITFLLAEVWYALSEFSYF